MELLTKFFPLSNSLNRKLKEFAVKEKLEIVKERGEAANFSRASPRPATAGRNASELFSVYTAGFKAKVLPR